MPLGILDSNPFSGVNPNTPFLGGIGQATGAYNNPTPGAFQIPVNVASGGAIHPQQYSAPIGPQQVYGPPAPASSGGGGFAPSQPSQQSQPQQTFDPYAQLRNQISSGWDQYTGQLNDILNNGLPQQQSAQNNIINSQYDQGVNTANTQKAASLKDIADTISNAFKAGNNFLGARGAGDSSAANQYGFAINQEAMKQNSNLNDFVNSQLSNLGSQRDQQLNGVANWYANAQNQLKQQIANGSIGKSQDLASLSSNILNQGLSAINQIQQQSQAQYNAMTQWAANNAGSLQGLQQQIASIPQPAPGIQLDSGGNLQVPVGYGYSNNDQTKNGQTSGGIFSNPSWFQ